MSNIGIVQELPALKAPAPNGRERYTTEAAGKHQAISWKGYEKVAFRIAFIFFICICIPNSAEWYGHVIHIDWTHLHYRDLYDIARFGSGINFFGDRIFGSSLLGYANWIITLAIAIAAGIAWTLIDRRRTTPALNYERAHYWLRAIVRYRAGIGIIGFGFTKLLPVQMPYPSLGLLNTDFGDLTSQKIYWLSIGIVPWYQVFAGVVEVAAGTLLFFRRTTTLGAALLFGALGDIVYVNFAYDGGVHVYSSYFVLLAAFLLIPDLPRIYNLLIRERPIVPFNFYPMLTRWQQYARVIVKTTIVLVFLVLLFYLQYTNFRYDPYKQPSTAGVHNLRGNYTVTDFRINGRQIAYDPLDSLRWKEVTFEKWTTLTYRANRATMIDLSNGGGDPMRDINRNFEITGTGGGQRAFHYYADTIDHVLYLQDKYKDIPDRRNRAAGVGGDGDYNRNKGGATEQKPSQQALPGSEGKDNRIKGIANEPGSAAKQASAGDWIGKTAWSHIGDENRMIDPRAWSTRRDREFAQAPGNEKRNRMVLHYETTDGSHVILKGIDEKKDSIYVVLDRINKNYVIEGSRLQAGKY